MFLGGSACVAEVKIEIGFSSFFTKIPLLFHCDMLKIYLHIYILIFWDSTILFFLIPSRISISSLLHPRLLPQMWYFVQTSFSSLYGFDYFWDPRRPIPPVSLPVITTVLSLAIWVPSFEWRPLFEMNSQVSWLSEPTGIPFAYSCIAATLLGSCCCLRFKYTCFYTRIYRIIYHLVLQSILFIAT